MVDIRGPVIHPCPLKHNELRKILKGLGCDEVRQSGSHLRVRFGACNTTIPVHPGEDLGKGLLRSIEKDLEPCLGKGWLKRQKGR